VTLVLTTTGTEALAAADAAMTRWLAGVLDLADDPGRVTAALAVLGDALIAQRRAVAP
jgi:hypothetical protein